MRKIVQILILIFLISGCGSLKQGWNDFTAYYNTFYNAKKFYNTGLQLNRNQLPDIDSFQLIRVHPPPTNAGMEDFEKAIEKASGILRNHEDSKFVIPALFIIGKSYYFRSEFFSALEKFQELNAIATGEERQEAIVWLGLTYLEMSNHPRGIEVLEYELEGEESWAPEWRARAQIVLGELYSEVENWEVASQYLESSLSEIEDHEMKGKTRFLLGQTLEKMGELNRALFSYHQINDLRTSFDLEFNATKKQAEISRQAGNYDYAITIFQTMRRDDKFIENRSDLQYEIAHTRQLKGDQDEAIQNYNDVLRNRSQPPSTITMAKTYYGLAEIYRDEIKNLRMAAAYFDSAASQRVERNQLPEDFNARDLANSFGEYVSIKQNISEKDSLLSLAEMDREKLDNFIEELRQQELEKIEAEVERIQEQRDQMIVADQTEEVLVAEESTEYGFLNISNPTRLADASLQFQAIWGDRPLADNWRRRSAVSGSRFDQIREAVEQSAHQNSAEINSTGFQPTMDISNIPFTDEEKEIIKSEIEALNYHLGNVFFLSLDMPDSSRVYYHKVIDSGYDQDLVTQSLYSIAEIELLSGNREEAEKWYGILNENRSGSIYTSRLADRLGIETDEQPQPENSQTEFNYRTFFESDTTKSPPDKARELVMLADTGADESVRPLLLFDAAKQYMQQAKSEPGFEEEIRQWYNRQREIESERDEFEALKDSAQIMLADTSLTETQRQYWIQVDDSTFREPDLKDVYPFEGAYWDSTRSVLERIENQYSASTIVPQVKILRETLARPAADTTRANDTLSVETGRMYPDQDDIEYTACEDVGVNIDVEGGMESFMNSLTYPDWTSDVSLRGELKYLFEIEPDGNIRSYEQLSRMGRSGIPQAVETGIEENLTFSPPPDGQTIRCTVIFPFNL